MVCHICGKPASFRCPVCGRYACNKHTRSTDGIQYFENWLAHIGDSFENLPHYICDACFKQATEYSNAEAQDIYYHTHYCDFHKCYHNDEYLRSDRFFIDELTLEDSSLGVVYCETCKKQLCSNVAIKGETKEYKDGDPFSHESKLVLLKVTEYLCPICRSTIFIDIGIYDEIPAGRHWSTSYEFCSSYKYSRTKSVRKYIYQEEAYDKWTYSIFFDNIIRQMEIFIHMGK